MKAIINPAYIQLKEFVSRLPDIFDEQGVVIYGERNILKVFEAEGLSVCVKSFHRPYFFNRIAYGFFRPSKAKRSYEHALALLHKGIDTPAPIAYIEDKRGGMLYNSYYICINHSFDGMMRELREGALQGREQLLSEFARFAAAVHNRDILHKDFSPSNILYEKPAGEYVFYLVDINRMIFREVDMEAGCENLKRLWGSNEMIRFIAREYAAARSFDPDECERLTLHYHTKFWKKYTKRHQGFLPYIEQ